MKKLFLFTLILFIAVGCTTKITNYKFVSTKNVDLNSKYVLVQENVSELMSQVMVIYLYYGFDDMSYYAAMGKCLEKYDAQIMTDCKVTTTSYFFLIGVYTDYKVEGDVWRTVNSENAHLYNPQDIYELYSEDGQDYLVNTDGVKHKIDYNSKNG